MSTSLRVAYEPPSVKRRRPDPKIRGWIKRMYWSMRLRRISDLTSSPLPRITRSFPGSSLSLATESAASAFRSVELLHGNGSRSVVDDTYLGVLLSTSVNGLSVRLGHTA